MAKLFLSHSTKDKEFVRKLAVDLQNLGHFPWLDEWEIKVGDYITEKIEKGLLDSEYLILVLSRHAVESNWVNREWKTRFWKEIQTKEITLLPVLIENCEIPTLIADKKYADFTTDYEFGLEELKHVLKPIKKEEGIHDNLQHPETASVVHTEYQGSKEKWWAFPIGFILVLMLMNLLSKCMHN